MIGPKCTRGNTLSGRVRIGRNLGRPPEPAGGEDATASPGPSVTAGPGPNRSPHPSEFRPHGACALCPALVAVQTRLAVGSGRAPRQGSGGYGGGVPPVPIPNTAVPPSSAHGTEREAARESRSPPEHPWSQFTLVPVHLGPGPPRSRSRLAVPGPDLVCFSGRGAAPLTGVAPLPFPQGRVAHRGRVTGAWRVQTPGARSRWEARARPLGVLGRAPT